MLLSAHAQQVPVPGDAGDGVSNAPLGPRGPATPASAQTPPLPPPSDLARRRQATPQDDTSQELDKVDVVGVKSDATQRRESTAAKIVVGREEIERFGDSTLDEVLKRLPSVSIVGRARRGGSIVMRGLGHGYTQILINGERIPPGFSIDQLVPDQVERIEIYRAPTAETGARAIAGTINIVLREALKIHIDEVRVQVGDETGRAGTNVSWIRNDVFADKGTYNFTLSFAQTDFFTQTDTKRDFSNVQTGQTLLDQDINTNQVDRRDNLHLTSRIEWTLAPGEQIIVQPFLTLSETETGITGTLFQRVGDTPAPYATSLSDGNAHSAFGRIQLMWNKLFANGLKLEVKSYVGGFVSDSQALLTERDSALDPVLAQQTNTNIIDHSWNFNAKATDRLGSGHSLVAGVEFEQLDRNENAGTVQNGVPLLAAFGSDVTAQVNREAAYLQDDWDPIQHVSTEVGVRWEGIQTDSENRAYDVSNDSSVLTPLAHAVWRFDEPARDQLRLSLTRSYRTPTLQNLVGLPTVNTLYPVGEPNVASAPDTAGNPHLKPELATGIDLALEHYDLRNGVMSVSIFDRNIHDLIRSVTSLQPVLYSPVERWVSQPVNFGNATAQGIEADAKFELDTLWKNAWPILVNANMSIFRSRVDDVMCPNNRLDQQPNVLANLGGDYTFSSIPWRMGANVSWTPPFTIQNTDTQSTFFGLRRQIDVYGLWTLNPDTKLRFSVTNALPVNYVTGVTTLQGNQSQNVLTTGRTTTLFAVRLELKL